MTEIIIGSTALNRHWPETREPKDLDVLTDEYPSSKGIEVFWDPSLKEYFGDSVRVATPEELFAIKLSHSYWELPNGSWNKHIYDLQWMLSKGVHTPTYIRPMQDLHDLLYKIWEMRYGKKKVDLSMESDDFFADAVKRKYDHDSIHASVAYFDEPMYTRVLKDGKSVQMDMAKVWALPFEDQVRLFREEIYATALERILVPRGYRSSATAAYWWALRRTVTSLTKGKSAQFILENIDTFSKPDCDYVQRHLDNRDRLIRL